MKHTKTNNHSQSHLLVIYSSKFLSSAYFGLRWEAIVPRKKPRRHRVNKQTLHRKTPDLIQPVTLSVGDNQHEFYLYQFAFLQHANFSALCRNSKGVTNELREVSHIPGYTVEQFKSSGFIIKINKIEFQPILKNNIHREVMMMMKALCFVRSFPSLLCLPGMGRIRMQKTDRLQKEAMARTEMWSRAVTIMECNSNLIITIFKMQRSQAHTMLTFLMKIPLPRFSFI